MKSKIAIVLTGLVGLLQSATVVHSQQVYSVGNYPAGQAAYQPQHMPVQYYGQPAVYPGQQPVQAVQHPAMQHWQGHVISDQPISGQFAPRDLNSIVTTPDYSAPATTSPLSPGMNSVVPESGGQLGCSGDGGCDACDSCDGCGSPSCACTCGGSLLRGLFGGGGGLRGSLHHAGEIFHDRRAPRPSWLWVDGEVMALWSKGRHVPVLATTSVPGTPFGLAGVLGSPGTSVLFGGDLGEDAEIAYRGMLGVWFDPEQTCGVAGRGFFFGPEETDFSAQSQGLPILARPFFDVDLNVQDSLVVAYPGFSSGSIDIHASTEIQAYEVFLRKMLYYGYGNRLDFIGGFHSTRIDDSVRINDVIVSQGPNGVIPFGSRLETDDIFRAKNEFYGGEIGLMTQGFDGRLTWNLLTKISFGSTRETVSISGQTTATVPGGGSSTQDIGLLALPSNIGVYEDDEFTLVPELALNVAYSLNSRLQVSLGYTVIYWSNAAFASDAINTNINPTQIAPPVIGPALPVYTLNDDDFWVQGITLGLNARY